MYLNPDPSAAEVDQGHQRLGRVEAETPMHDQADAAGEPLEPAVGETEIDRRQDAGLVLSERAGQLDERLQLRAGGGAQPACEQTLGVWARLRPVEGAQLLLEQVAAVEGRVQLGEEGERPLLALAEGGGVLEQRPARALDDGARAAALAEPVPKRAS